MITDYKGYKIIEDRSLSIRKTRMEKRTWRERFFSLPWRPRWKYKGIKYLVPSDKMYFNEKDKTFIMHPDHVKMLREALDADYKTEITTSNSIHRGILAALEKGERR